MTYSKIGGDRVLNNKSVKAIDAYADIVIKAWQETLPPKDVWDEVAKNAMKNNSLFRHLAKKG